MNRITLVQLPFWFKESSSGFLIVSADVFFLISILLVFKMVSGTKVRRKEILS